MYIFFNGSYYIYFWCVLHHHSPSYIDTDKSKVKVLRGWGMFWLRFKTDSTLYTPHHQIQESICSILYLKCFYVECKNWSWIEDYCKEFRCWWNYISAESWWNYKMMNFWWDIRYIRYGRRRKFHFIQYSQWNILGQHFLILFGRFLCASILLNTTSTFHSKV